MLTIKRLHIILLLIIFASGSPLSLIKAQGILVADSLRGRIDAERQGLHDANKIRTMFYNYGMVGDYPPDPGRVDYSIFHSVEVPKGSGENYSDGTTPFVLAKVMQNTGVPAYIMETGYRERQGVSPITSKTMRFEPRPGYFQNNADINKSRSIAMSNDSRTWPDKWIDKIDDADDPGWSNWWNGYFGKEPKADQESFAVYDDNFYDAWSYYPDSRDNTRRGLGLKVEQRGFQWANPQAAFVIFFHYDITNESTTKYDNNILFGLYMDSGVGGSGIGLDGVYESDDDNAFFEESAEINLVYTWDKNNRGVQGTTGYLGYSYLETPGNPYDAKDNDLDGITNEKRDGGEGIKIEGRENIKNYVLANYDYEKFKTSAGLIEDRPAYVRGTWFTGDEDLDWNPEFDDTGADGVFGTNDTGERDNRPTSGEPNFDKVDIDESDQIGLTGFKMNRIVAGAGSPVTAVDNIVFFDDGKDWPKRLYNIFTNPDSAFDMPLVLNYNIGFLFASGPFILDAGKKERFSLALGFGQDLRRLRTTTKVVEQIYEANYLFAVPPPLPTVNAFAGDGYVTLTWNDAAERTYDPITSKNDFEGYKIYRSTDPTFLDPIGPGSSEVIGNGKPLAQYDLINEHEGFTETIVEQTAYFLGSNTGLVHTYKDTTVKNGQRYFYAVCAYDHGVDSIQIYPSENAITVSQTLRGGLILPKNVAVVYPNPASPGYVPAEATAATQIAGDGSGTVSVKVLNPALVPDNHVFNVTFSNSRDSVRAQYYSLIDVTAGDTLFVFGKDMGGGLTGPVASGLLPIVTTPSTVVIDSAGSKFNTIAATNVKYKARYSQSLPIAQRRPGFPDDIKIVFSNSIVDTSVAYFGATMKAKPVKFNVYAVTDTGDLKLKFRFYSLNENADNFSEPKQYIEVMTAANSAPTTLKATWKIEYDTVSMAGVTVVPPAAGDIYTLKVRDPLSSIDKFSFTTKAQYVDESLAAEQFKQGPYVVPNPYVGAASFEPQRFAVSGRGERKIEFRNIPSGATIRIFTLSGELVETLRHDGTATSSAVSWNLRNSDNLEVAPGLYIYHVDASKTGEFIGKFAIIK